MELIVIGLAAIAIIFVVPLAVLRAGIRRQERAACFACQPPGLCAALTRRLVGLSAREPGCGGWCRQPQTRPALVSERETSL